MHDALMPQLLLEFPVLISLACCCVMQAAVSCFLWQLDARTPRDVITFAFDMPVVSSLSVVTGLTSGGFAVTVLGVNFGSSFDFASFGSIIIEDDLVRGCWCCCVV